METFGRFFQSPVLKATSMATEAERLSDKGYTCKKFNPLTSVSLTEYLKTYPEATAFTLNLGSIDIELIFDLPKGRIRFAGDFSPENAEKEQEFIENVTEFFDWAFEEFEFEFGFIDKEGDTSAKLFQFIEENRIQTLFFLNYFGKKFVDKFGADYFLNAPGNAEVLPQGSIKYFSREKIGKPTASESQDLYQYFKSEGLITLFKAKKSEDW